MCKISLSYPVVSWVMCQLNVELSSWADLQELGQVEDQAGGAKSLMNFNSLVYGSSMIYKQKKQAIKATRQ